MPLINFISSLASTVGRKKKLNTIGKDNRTEPIHVKLTILETNSYFQDPFVKEGIMIQKPKVGEHFRLMDFDKDTFIHSTTKVTSVIDEFTFTTSNSKYRIEPLK